MDAVASLVEKPAKNGSGAGSKEQPREVGVNTGAPRHTAELDIDASRSLSGSSEEESGDEWETESLYEDALQFITDEQLRNGSMYSAYITYSFLEPNAIHYLLRC